MSDIEKFVRDSIQKNTGILVTEADENILEKDISPLDLLYVVDDIEQRYDLSPKNIIQNITPDSFTIKQLVKIISTRSKVINAQAFNYNNEGRRYFLMKKLTKKATAMVNTVEANATICICICATKNRSASLSQEGYKM